MTQEATSKRVARSVLEEAAGKKETSYEAVQIPEEFGPVQLVVDDHKIKTFAFTQDDYRSWYLGDSPFGGRIGHANILANVHVLLAPDLARALRPGGLLLTSGIISNRALEVEQAFTSAGLTAVERRQEGDWVALAHQTSSTDA
jgi:hypothetical protein